MRHGRKAPARSKIKLYNYMENPTQNDPPVALHRLVRPLWMTSDPACDWIEDAGHENGQYFCQCIPCRADFLGHKRRHVCRKCYMANKAAINAMSEESRDEYYARRNAELRGWSRTNVEWWHRRREARIQTGRLSPVATHGLIVKRSLERGWLPRLCEESAEDKHTTRAKESAKTRQNQSAQPKPETLQKLGETQVHNSRRRLGGESNDSAVCAMVFNLPRSSNVRPRARRRRRLNRD